MLTLAALVEGWLALRDGDAGKTGGEVQPGRRRSNIVSPHWRKTQISLCKHLVEAIGSVDVDELGPADVWSLQEFCIQRGLSAETTNKITHNVLSGILNQSALVGTISPGIRDRTLKPVDPLDPDDESPGQALTVPARDRLLRVAHQHWSGNLVAFLVLTGSRVGEASALRQRHVDWEHGYVRIAASRRLSQRSGGKNKPSRRTVHLAKAAMAAIRPLHVPKDPEALLFRGALGGPFNVDNYRDRDWPELIAAAKLPGLRIHDLRHSFITQCLEAGLPLARIASYVGARISTLEKRYAHVLPARDIDTALEAPVLRWRKTQEGPGADAPEPSL